MVRPVQESDMAYLWAAYRLGIWDDVMDSELSKEGFHMRIAEIIAIGEMDWVVEAPNDGNMRPVGLILAHMLPDGRRIEPHVVWFPWATPRNKLEGIGQFLREVRKRFKILVYSRQETRGFFDRLAQYRLIRSGCRIQSYYEDGEPAYFFYTT